MIFRFGKKKVSDFIKVVQFMEKEGIDFEVVGELGVNIGAEETPSESQPSPPVDIEDHRIKAVESDPLWRPAAHDNRFCKDKEGCKDVTHYGAQPLD